MMKKAILLLSCCVFLSAYNHDGSRFERHAHPRGKVLYCTTHPKYENENPLYKLSITAAYVKINDYINGSEYHVNFETEKYESLRNLIAQEHDNIMPNLGLRIKEGKLLDFINHYIAKAKVPESTPEIDIEQRAETVAETQSQSDTERQSNDGDEHFFTLRDDLSAKLTSITSDSSPSLDSAGGLYIRRVREYAVVPLAGLYCIAFDNPDNLPDGFYPKSHFAKSAACILDSVSYHKIEDLRGQVLREIRFDGLRTLKDYIDMLDEIVETNTLKIIIMSSNNSLRSRQEIKKFVAAMTNKAKEGTSSQKQAINNDIAVLAEIFGEQHFVFKDLIIYSYIWGCYTMREFLT